MVIAIQSDDQQLWLSLKITTIKTFLLCQTLAGELRFLWMLNLSERVHCLKMHPFGFSQYLFHHNTTPMQNITFRFVRVGVKEFKWPAEIAELNPTENLWDYLE